MNLRRLIAAAAAGSAIAASAQLSALPDRFSPGADGYMARAREMQAASNYAGVIDQLNILLERQIPLSPEVAEECTFMLADAYFNRGDSECLRLLIDFRRLYPSSPLAPEATVAIGDYYFFAHRWPEALEAYREADPARLNRDRRPQLTYRMALSLIRTGHYAEARPLVRKLSSDGSYRDAAIFYTAYLDYIDGDFRKAYAGFERVPAGIPGLDARYYLAQIEYVRGEYDNVIRRTRPLLAGNTDADLLPETERIAGMSYFKKGDYQSALPLLLSYLEAVPDSPSPEAIYAAGAISYASGNYRNAASLFSRITGLNDKLGQGAWLYLGQCALREDNPSSAAMAFEKAAALDLDPAVTESALYNYAAAVTRGGNVPFASSASLLEQFVRRFPDSEFAPKVESYLAAAYFNDHKYARALECAEQIARPSADDLRLRQKILFQYGVEQLTNGHAREAATLLSRAAGMRSSDRSLAAEASLWLGDACYAQAQFRNAVRAYSDFISAAPRSNNRPLALYDLAYARYKLGDYRAAAADFARAIDAMPALPENLLLDARVRRADCLYYTADYSGARSLYSQAINAGAPDTDYALYRRAVVAGLTGDSKSKISDLKELEKRFPDSQWLASALQELAVTYEESGRADLAADAYKKRLGAAKDVDSDELFRIAETMHRASRWNDLLEITAKIRRAGGLSAEETADLDLYDADAFSATSRSREAEDIYRRLASTPESLAGARGAVALGEMLLKQKRSDEAMRLLTDFTDAGTPHQYWLARGFILLADAYSAQGKDYLAKEYLISLRDNYPGDEADISNMISSRLKKLK